MWEGSCRCNDVATEGCMRGWSTQVGERKNKQKSKKKAKTYEGRIIQPDSFYRSLPMKGRRTVKIVEISTEVE